MDYNTNHGVIMMLKAYKYRIYPSDEQKVQLLKTFGCSRFVYNYYLNLL